jgi:hypothetical protein
MPTALFTKNYADFTGVTQRQFDDLFESIEVFVNNIKLGSDNFNTDILDTLQFAAKTLVSGNFATNAVTNAKLETDSITANAIKNEALINRHFTNAVVTNLKLQAINRETGDSSTTSFGSGSDTLLCECSITTSGRPIFIFLCPKNAPSIGLGGNAMYMDSIKIYENTDLILDTSSDLTVQSGPGFRRGYTFFGMHLVRNQPAGTYTYSVYIRPDTGFNLTGGSFRIIAVEYR